MTGQERQSPPAPPPGTEPEALHLRVGLSSDRGPSRDLNEDYADYYLPSDEAQRRAKGSIFVVADGMGGHQAGEVASKEAVRRVMEGYYADASPDPGESLNQAISAANHALHQHASSDSAKSGMGTTLVAAVIIGSDVYIASVGDSRAYGINEETITQITRDHSWVEEQVKAGILTQEQAQKHPQRNLITRALGTRQTVEADLFEGKLLAGDALLLCTDGVCGPLSEDQMAQAVRSLPPTRAAAQLVAQAGEEGGKDNASALIVKAVSAEDWAKEQARLSAGVTERVQPAAPASVAPGTGQDRRRWVLGGAVAACVILCLLAAVLFVPALTQKLAGEPVAAPLPAPVQDGRLAGSSADQVALYLGYTDANQMIAAHGGLLAPESLGSSDLKPAMPGVFLVGTAREWACDQQECSFRLSMAGIDFAVTYQPGERDLDLDGHPVRVYGPQQEDQPTVAAQLIERGSRWWAWWQPAWTLVHHVGSLDQITWVYSTVDRNPNGLLEPSQAQGLQQSTQVLLRGLWRAQKSLVFEEDQIYQLQGSRYVPLMGQPSPPVPTVTLQPTRAVLLHHHLGIESAGSGE